MSVDPGILGAVGTNTKLRVLVQNGGIGDVGASGYPDCSLDRDARLLAPTGIEETTLGACGVGSYLTGVITLALDNIETNFAHNLAHAIESARGCSIADYRLRLGYYHPEFATYLTTLGYVAANKEHDFLATITEHLLVTEPQRSYIALDGFRQSNPQRFVEIASLAMSILNASKEATNAATSALVKDALSAVVRPTSTAIMVSDRINENPVLQLSVGIAESKHPAVTIDGKSAGTPS
jgi:hypothetical protein